VALRPECIHTLAEFQDSIKGIGAAQTSTAPGLITRTRKIHEMRHGVHVLCSTHLGMLSMAGQFLCCDVHDFTEANVPLAMTVRAALPPTVQTLAVEPPSLAKGSRSKSRSSQQISLHSKRITPGPRQLRELYSSGAIVQGLLMQRATTGRAVDGEEHLSMPCSVSHLVVMHLICRNFRHSVCFSTA